MLNVVTHEVASRLKDSKQEILKQPTVLTIQVRTHRTILIIRTDLLNLFKETAAVYCCGIMQVQRLWTLNVEIDQASFVILYYNQQLHN